MEPDILSDLFRQIIIHNLAIGPAIALVLAVLLLLASAFISACETAYFALNSEEQSDLKEENDRRSQLALRLLENPDRLTATFLIADNVVNVFFIKRDLARCRGVAQKLIHAREGAQKRGLAASGGTDQSGHFSITEFKIDVKKGLVLAVVKVNVFGTHLDFMVVCLLILRLGHLFILIV